jgi:hypothetical protein
MLACALVSICVIVPGTLAIYGDVEWWWILGFELALVGSPSFIAMIDARRATRAADYAPRLTADIALGLGMITALLVLIGGQGGVLVSFATIPVGVASMAVVLVRPSAGDWPSTVIASLVLLGCAVWLLGQGDESLAALAVSAFGLWVSVTWLRALHRRSQKRPGLSRQELLARLREPRRQ